MLTSVGTDGDIFPYLELGTQLRLRGHKISAALPAHHAEAAKERDLGFYELVSDAELDELLGNSDFWHPYKAAPLAASWGTKLIPRQLTLLRNLAADKDSVLVANPGVMAAALIHEELGQPWCSLVLQPGIIPSSIAPPMMPGLPILQWPPVVVRKLFWRGLDLMGDLLVGRSLNQIRRRLGLPIRQRLFSNWLSKQLSVGLWPAWYAPPQADWPPQLELAGFPASRNGTLDAEIAAFCGAGAPPVAITFGTGMMHARRQIRNAVEACQSLGLRCIVLTKYATQVPNDLAGPGVMHRQFAPFSQLLPRCTALIHHGGIGTVTAGIAAKVPQLILPFAYDQLDNAARVKKFGLGSYLKQVQATPARIAAALREIISPEQQSRCQAFKRSDPEADGIERTADLIEALAARAEQPLRK